jgi:hypothetical protein
MSQEKETLLAALAASESHTASTTLSNGTILQVEMKAGDCFDVIHIFPGRNGESLLDRLEVESKQGGIMDKPVWEAE